MLLGCIAAAGILVPRAEAASVEADVIKIVERAASRFRVNVLEDELCVASSSFFMEAEQSVTINASYSPQSASVDFGLIGPDGRFYHQNAKNGTISAAFDIKERGEYTLAVRNNSPYEISVSGYVNY